MLSYPVDIFDSSAINSKTYNCSSSEDPTTFHQCSAGGDICPVQVENIMDALSPIKWKVHSGICRFRSQVRKADPRSMPTIHILGGSVTAGRYTAGCCCDLDTKCPAGPNVTPASLQALATDQVAACSHYTPVDYSNGGGCGWVHYFSHWVSKSMPGVRVKLLAMGGTTSQSSFLSRPSSLFSANIVQPYDLILFDYSVNDQTQDGKNVRTITGAVEGFVRYFMAKGFMPGMVLIESWPHGEFIPFEFQRISGMEADTKGYSAAYRRVARHYNLSVVSYMNAVNSAYMTEYQPSFVSYAQWKHIELHRVEHPHWFAHILQGDLVAGSLATILRGCAARFTDVTSFRALFYSLPELIQNAENASIKDVIAHLPEPMELNNHFSACDDNILMQLEAPVEYSRGHTSGRAVNVPYSTLNLSTNTLLFNSKSWGWSLTDDERNKPGFVSYMTKPSSSLAKALDNPCDTSGEGSIHVMRIPIRFPPDDQEKKIGSYLRVEFLRTYENIGAVDVCMCGRHIGRLDGIWNHPEKRHYSIAQIAIFTVCDSLCPAMDSQSDQFSGVSFVHRYVDDDKSVHRGDRQKFKLISVMSCQQVGACSFLQGVIKMVVLSN